MSTPSTMATTPKPTQSKSGIRRKIIATTIGVTAASIAILVAYFINDTRKTLSAEHYSKLQGFANLKGSEVENYFQELRGDLASSVEDDTIRNAARDLAAAKASLRAELANHGAPLDRYLETLRKVNREYIEANLVAYLSKLQFAGLKTAEQYLTPDDEGQILQYIYIVSNPSPLGRKAERNSIEDIRQREIDPRLREAFTKTTYAAVHERVDEVLQRRAERVEADLHIVGTDGFVLYTTSKQLDFGGNLVTGADRDQGFGKVHTATMSASITEKTEDMIRLNDFEPYSKALGVPSSFLGCAILNKNREKLGSYTIEVPSEQVYNILSHNDRHRTIGLGESGENYLVARDKKARSNSRFISNDHDLPMGTHKKWYFDEDGKTIFTNTINTLTVDTKATRDIFDDRKTEGSAIYPDYRGIPVFGYYRKLKIPGLDYMILSEIDEAEVFAPINAKITTLLIIAVATLLAGLWAALRFGDRLAKPIVSLADVAGRVTKGDDSARATVASDDEVGSLAGAFNEMVEARAKSQKTLQDENQELQKQIRDLLVVVSDASDGKLNVRAPVTAGAMGNVSDALNLMLENVGSLIASAKTASEKVAKAASEITTAAKNLEEDEKRQTEQVGQTSSGVTDLNGQAQRVLKNCQTANQAAANARAAAEQGAQAVKDLIQGMERIRENVQANSKKIKRLGDRSMEIAGMVKIITDISAKTDMLALNASIEAARAGEQGRGFTIVAEQVRGLADRTRTLTSQIEKLVSDIQTETAEAVVQMEKMTQEVEGGSRTAQTAGSKLENIVTASTQSSELVVQINQAATQQASRAKEMLSIVDAIQRVVADAQVKVRDTRNTSEELAKLSTDLDKRLAQFEVGATSF